MKDIIVKYLITALLGIIFTFLCGVVKKLWADEKALKKGTQSLLRADIIRCYEKYSERGHCPIYARDALNLEYEAYHNLGANGIITELMNRLRELPTELQEAEP